MDERSTTPPPPPPEAVVGTLDPHEVKQLWWLLDGGIMDPAFRDRMRRSWGLCARHMWGFALVEIELRGGLPHATSILAEDLLMTGGEHRLLGFGRRDLTAEGACPTCEYAAVGSEVETSWTEATARAARAKRMRSLLEHHAEPISRWSCPVCMDGEGLTCRPHLLANGTAGEYLEAELHALARRARAGRRAHEPGVTPHPDERTAIAWAEAIGWLAGWDGVRVWGTP